MSRANTAVFWLGERDCEDRALVGGKAANLSRLYRHFTVPPGFCLSMAVPVPANALHGSRELHSEVVDQITAAYESLVGSVGSPSIGFAVRSSALVEDSETSTFAGQFQTYLNVVGIEALVTSVRNCWASSRSETVLRYCEERGMDPDQIGLAVLVQRMIMADSSAVAFSRDPLTDDPAVVVINANWGLGESLVGGRVNPDRYEVSRENLQLLSATTGNKKLMTVALREGTREIETPTFFRKEHALTRLQAQEVARIAMGAEAIMGWSVDIECAYRDGCCYLLQCRPITTRRNSNTASVNEPHKYEEPVGEC